MATSIQTFRGRHVASNDLDLLVVLWVASEVARREHPSAQLMALLNGWQRTVAAYAPGAIDLGLDQLETCSTDAAACAALLKQVPKELAALGATISGPFLNERIGVPGVRFGDYDTMLAADTARSLAELLTEPPPRDVPPGPPPE